MNRAEQLVTIRAVVETLRQISDWSDEDRAPAELRALADSVLGAWEQVEMLAFCCPMCQEVECDDGCPLAVVRAT